MYLLWYTLEMLDVWDHFDGLVQDYSNSGALAMELRQSLL